MAYGLDVHKKFIAVCALDDRGEKRGEFRIGGSASEIEAFAHARIETEKLDAHTLAKRLRARFVPKVELPNEATWAKRQRVPHRQLLMRQRGLIEVIGARLAEADQRRRAIAAAKSLACNNASPIDATYHAVRRKRGRNVAVTALARKLIAGIWHLLSKHEAYRYTPVELTNAWCSTPSSIPPEFR